jgi:hypothetical protein
MMKLLKYIFLFFFLSFLFIKSEVKEYFISCNPNDFQMIYDNYGEDIYIPITIMYKHQLWNNAEMRIRGETTRYAPKKSLKIKFNSEPFENGRYKINLNAEYQDPSYIHSYLAGRIFNESGIPCFNSQHVKLYLNGEYLGLYLQVENMDEQFLEYRGLDKNGNLYKATNDGACLSIYDDLYNHWEKKTNEGYARNDLSSLIDSLNNINDSEYYNFTKRVFDYDNMITIIAVNILLANASTYYHNYYMYHNINGNGKWYMLPWDIDKTFNTYNTGWHYAWSGPWLFPDNPYPERGILCDTIFHDIKEKIDEISRTIFNKEYLFPLIDSLKSELQQAVLNDKTDDIEDDLLKWNDWIRYTKEYISSRYDNLQMQFKNYPLSFKVNKIDSLQVDDVVINWESSISPNKSPVTYTLYYGTEPVEISQNVNKVEGIVDTSYVLNGLAEGIFYYKIEAWNNEGYNEGYDKYNKFILKKGTRLPCIINKDMMLTKEKSPFIVDCNIVVENGVKLTVNKGVTMLFNGFYNIDIKGVIETKGTEDEPVIFRPAPGINKWREIHMNLPSGKCEFHHTEFHNGIVKAQNGIYNFDHVKSFINDTSILDDAIYAEHADFTFTNGYIETNGIAEGIIVFESMSPKIENSTAVNTADSYQFVLCKDGIISNNISIGSSDDGIDQNGCKNTMIKNNIIANAHDKGISISHDGYDYSENIRIERNIIYDCPIALELKSGSTVSVLNNTLFNNDLGLHCFEKIPKTGGPIINFVNNIISGSKKNYILEDSTILNISYSLSDKDTLFGNNNILANPLFRDTLNRNFYLLPNSPCIDAGDPDSPTDPDGTRADIGAIYYNRKTPKIVINEIMYHPADDFDTKDWVEFYNADNYDVDMNDWIFKDSNDSHAFIFPKGFILGKGDYIVLVEDMTKFRNCYPDVDNSIAAMDFGLSNNGESLRLYDNNGILADSVEYLKTEPWPLGADGTGNTIELINPDYDNVLAENWSCSGRNGSPGEINSSYNKIDSNNNLDYKKFEIIKIYPNPAKKIINVMVTSSLFNDLNYDIFNSIGQKINITLNSAISNDQNLILTFNINKLVNGLYSLKIHSQNAYSTTSFIVYE